MNPNYDDLMALTENSDVKEKKKRPANFSNQARGDGKQNNMRLSWLHHHRVCIVQMGTQVESPEKDKYVLNMKWWFRASGMKNI